MRSAKTIVAVTSGGAYATADWLKSSGALVQTWYFGQEGGRALADVLFGHSPEGKLPFSFERRWEENPTHDNYYPQDDVTGPKPPVAYKEGLFVGYRYYTSMEKPVLYPFGYGLSYTKFRFDHLHVNQEHGTADSPWTVEFDVTDTGTPGGRLVDGPAARDPGDAGLSGKARLPVPPLVLYSFRRGLPPPIAWR